MKKTSILLTLLSFTVIFSSCESSKGTSKSIAEANGIMEIQHIRNASIIVSFNNLKILVDPVLSDKDAEPPMPFSNKNKNPLIQLPIDKSKIVENISAVLLTHYHSDHFDVGAEMFLPKDILIFCQPYDYNKLKEKGFSNLQMIDSVFNWKGIRISRFLTSHHKGSTGALPFGESSSFCLQVERESLFITGDAILDDRLSNSLIETNPQVIVANTGECQFTDENPVLDPNITMTLTRSELKEITTFLPNSKLIAIHMDAINHCSLGKNDLREYIENENLKKHIVIPNEGDIISYKQIVNN
jgi:L-ascorbate metabolism protein UlaG (beta-lactamase superfamily)